MKVSVSVSDQIKSLVFLQEIDLKIDGVKRMQNSLPSDLQETQTVLEQMKAELTKKEITLTEAEKNQRQTRAATELNEERLKRANLKLEVVKNAQEFQAASKEIEQLKKLKTSLDAQQELVDAEFTSITLEKNSLENRISEIDEELSSQTALVSGKDMQMKTEIAALLSERSQYTEKVELRILSLYNRVRAARSGIGIVLASEGRCVGCNMMVPAQLYNEIQRVNSIHSCPSCHRILFVDQTAPSEAASAVVSEAQLS